MPNPFAKGWNYFKASFDKSLDDNADPKILVHQAMQTAKKQHSQVEKQAAAVIGNAKKTRESIAVKERAVEQLQGQARQAVQLAEDANSSGDTAKAQEWETAAAQLATQLVAAEEDLEQTRSLAEQAEANAEQAKQAVKDSERRLRETLAQEDQLLLQAQQAKMAEQQQTSVNSLTGEVSLGANPTFEQIREKIENRYTTALGQAELSEGSAAQSAALADAREVERKAAGQRKLDQIRAQLGMGKKTQGGAEKSAAGDIDVTESAEFTPNPAPDQEPPGFPRDTRKA